MSSESHSLPSLGTILEGHAIDDETVAKIETSLGIAECSEAYLRAESPTEVWLLLFVRGRAHVAARLEDGILRPGSIAQLFRRRKEMVHYQLCRADPGLVLALSVLSQHEPAMRVPLAVADVSRILNETEAKGTDAVLAVNTQGQSNLAFCRQGVPASAYFADPSRVPTEESVKDQLLVFCYDVAPRENATVEVYDDLSIRRDDYAGRELTEYLSGKLGPLPFRLRVTRQGEVIERRLFENGRATVGRASANDVVLDDLGVSRKHCVIEWREDRYWVQDCGTANGIVVNAEKVAESELRFGDELAVSDFVLEFFDAGDHATREDLRTLLFAIPTVSQKAQLMYQDQVVALDATAFAIGKSDKARLRLSGFRMQPIQATILHEGGAKYRLMATMRGRRVKVNGRKVGVGGCPLESGNQISIGGHDLLFIVGSR